jgi:hypothetical protein
MRCMWNKMIFNVHYFCNNKLKIKIKLHCFIYFENRQVPFPHPVLHQLKHNINSASTTVSLYEL